MAADDELHDFDEESLLRALRAPGSRSELAQEERYVVAFRESRAARHNRGRIGAGGRAFSRRGGATRRLGVGTALAVAVGVSGGGVAAAYTGDLPDPLQNFAHRVLGPVGAPPADRDPRPRQSTAARLPASPSSVPGALAPTPSEPATTAATPSPTPEPSRESKPSNGPSGRPSKDPATTASSSPDASPTVTPAPPPPSTTPEVTPSPTDVPSETPSPSAQPPPVPATVTIDGGSGRVDVGQTASISGVVTDEEGGPVPATEVALQRRGPDGWERVATATSDESGSVTFESAPLTQTLVVRLRSASVLSAPWRLVMHPLLSISYEVGGVSNDPDDSDASVKISVAAAGGQAGDLVTVFTRRDGQRVIVGKGLLNADGSVQVGVSQSKRHATYVVLLQRSVVHGASRDSIRVTLPDEDS